MLFQEKALHFISQHRQETMKSCNFFYKSLDGKYIDSNERAAFVAGVESKAITDKKDIDLQWFAYSEQYLASDRLTLSHAQGVLKMEPCLNLKHLHVPTLTLKQAAVDNNGTAVGIFGATLYVDEMGFAELSEVFNFIHHSLCMKPSITPGMLLAPPPIKENLTKREQDCAHLLCLGMSAREIAVKLDLSKRTVESYIAGMKNKLGVARKSELIMKLVDDNFLTKY